MSHTEITKQKIAESRKGKKHSEKTKDKIRKAVTGKKSPNWKGGVSFEPYCHKFNKALKEKIRERDDRTCQICGAKEGKRKHCVHHVNYDESNCDPLLITLCGSCHRKIHHNKEYYKVKLLKILMGRGLLTLDQYNKALTNTAL